LFSKGKDSEAMPGLFSGFADVWMPLVEVARVGSTPLRLSWNNRSRERLFPPRLRRPLAAAALLPGSRWLPRPTRQFRRYYHHVLRGSGNDSAMAGKPG
jgi:hypothetical protein